MSTAKLAAVDDGPMQWLQWLRWLFEHTEGDIELRACPNVHGSGPAKSVFTRDVDELLEFIQFWSGKPYGVYVGMGTRFGGRGRAVDVRELPAQWIDIDRKEGVLEALKLCRLQPTAIVDSGRGYHLYYFLNEVAGQEDAAVFVEVLKGLRKIFDGDPAVCEIARIMRLPGTQNTKYDAPRPVTVVEYHPDRRYSLADLKDLVETQQPVLVPVSNPFIAAAGERKEPVDLANMRHGNIHVVQRDYAMKMAGLGRPEDEAVEEILTATRKAAGAEGGEWDWDRERHKIEDLYRSGKAKAAESIDYTDDGLALAWGAEVVGSARYVKEWGQWYFWGAANWQRDRTNLVWTLIREFIRPIAKGAGEKLGKELRAAKKIAGLVSLVGNNRGLTATTEQWDADPLLFGTPEE